jgi:protein arginine kinase activator
MLCESCGNAEASIQVTRVVNNEMRVLHLCESCAAEQGLDPGPGTGGNLPLVDFLAQISAGAAEESPPTGRCPTCGLTPAQLKQTGRLGCATCYVHFEPHLRSLLRRLHGGTQHAGKVAVPPESEDADRRVRMDALRRSLQRAVDSEDFEHAASLRDQIRRMESAE